MLEPLLLLHGYTPFGETPASRLPTDCDPFEAGMEVDRFFSARHMYVVPGEYSVRVSLVRAERRVARAGAAVRIIGRFASSRW